MHCYCLMLLLLYHRYLAYSRRYILQGFHEEKAARKCISLVLSSGDMSINAKGQLKVVCLMKHTTFAVKIQTHKKNLIDQNMRDNSTATSLMKSSAFNRRLVLTSIVCQIMSTSLTQNDFIEKSFRDGET